MMDCFVTTNKHDYRWPFGKPLLTVPSCPPLVTKPMGTYMKVPLDKCKCEGHGWHPHMEKLKCLLEKEKKLHHDIAETREQITGLANDVVKCTCEPQEGRMKTLYETDFIAKDYRKAEYRPIMAAIDAPVDSIIQPISVKIQRGYRDPFSFRFHPITRPKIEPSVSINFATTPHGMRVWFQPWPGKTEYQDAYCGTAVSIVKNSQRFKEPMPSSRRRFGDTCV